MSDISSVPAVLQGLVPVQRISFTLVLTHFSSPLPSPPLPSPPHRYMGDERLVMALAVLLDVDIPSGGIS